MGNERVLLSHPRLRDFLWSTAMRPEEARTIFDHLEDETITRQCEHDHNSTLQAGRDVELLA
jgi:hypothetical protein